MHELLHLALMIIYLILLLLFLSFNLFQNIAINGFPSVHLKILLVIGHSIG